jgi:tripeptidyl-peptidase-1
VIYFNPVIPIGCGTQGFEAATGWDAITGLGTPDYGRLAAAVRALP